MPNRTGSTAPRGLLLDPRQRRHVPTEGAVGLRGGPDMAAVAPVVVHDGAFTAFAEKSRGGTVARRAR